jgi:hypothetical protein
VMDRNELFRAQRGLVIKDPSPSVKSTSFGKRMGAAGFEPAASWSEAKCSVQAELSALHDWQVNVEIKTPRFVCRAFILGDIR